MAFNYFCIEPGICKEMVRKKILQMGNMLITFKNLLLTTFIFIFITIPSLFNLINMNAFSCIYKSYCHKIQACTCPTLNSNDY